MNKKIKKIFGIISSVALGTSALLAVSQGFATADGGFKAGNIISDENFYVSSPSMSAAEIQTFLNTRGASCKSGGGKTCLKDYSETTIAKSADQFCPNPYPGGGKQSAAEIIYNSAKACGIAPQVLLVTLQKEQSLITAAGNSIAYKSAMGYGCPDGSPCNRGYAGLQNQIYSAARQFQRYRLRPNEFSFHKGQTANVQYNYVKSCGSSPVYLENHATAALYNYTPYQPNQALLNGGKGDNCSSSGNLNFYNLYQGWFVDPHGTPKVASKPVEVPENTGNTGTQANTKKQAENVAATEPTGNPVPADTAATKQPKLVEKDAIKSNDVVLKKDDAGSYLAIPAVPIVVEAQDFPAEAAVSATLDGKSLALEGADKEGKIKADKEGNVKATFKFENSAENAVLQLASADGKSVEVKFKVLGPKPPSLLSVKDEKTGKLIASGAEVQPKQVLTLQLADLTADTTPEVEVVGLGELSTYKLPLKLTEKADASGQLTVSFPAPERYGNFKVIARDFKSKLETTVFTFVVAKPDPAPTTTPVQTRAEKKKGEAVDYHQDNNALAQTGTVGGLSGVLALILFVAAWQIRRYVRDNRPISVNC